MPYNPSTVFDASASLPTSANGTTDTLADASADRRTIVLFPDPENTDYVYVTVDGSAPSSTNWQLKLAAGVGFVHDIPSGGEVRAIGGAADQKLGGWVA